MIRDESWGRTAWRSDTGGRGRPHLNPGYRVPSENAMPQRTRLCNVRSHQQRLSAAILTRLQASHGFGNYRENTMTEKTSWEAFFDAHAPVYDENVFATNTVNEVDFLLEELGLATGDSVLDVGCGTGRHSVELATRGYVVTGLDLSSEMLAKASAAAKAASVHVQWIRSDATRFSLPGKYDAAICLCEGSFGLLSQTDDPIAQPLSILCNISRSLKRQAKVVATVLSAARMLRTYSNEDVATGRFDPLTLVESSEMPPRAGLPAIAVRERGFVATELTLLFRIAGLSVVNMWGGTAGNWGRRTLDLDEHEIMIVATKTAEPSAGADTLPRAASP